MKAEVIIIVGTLLTLLGVNTSNVMFPYYNRPKIFRGKWGNLFFFVINTGIILGTMSLLIWSFKEVTWYISVFLIFGCVLFFSLIFHFLPIFLRSALGPIFSSLGLLILHYIMWSK